MSYLGDTRGDSMTDADYEDWFDALSPDAQRLCNMQCRVDSAAGKSILCSQAHVRLLRRQALERWEQAWDLIDRGVGGRLLDRYNSSGAPNRRGLYNEYGETWTPARDGYKFRFDASSDPTPAALTTKLVAWRDVLDAITDTATYGTAKSDAAYTAFAADPDEPIADLLYDLRGSVIDVNVVDVLGERIAAAQ